MESKREAALYKIESSLDVRVLETVNYRKAWNEKHLFQYSPFGHDEADAETFHNEWIEEITFWAQNSSASSSTRYIH